MRLDLFSKDDNVLLLGEGNFSFSVGLVKQQLPINITATCFEKEVSYEKQQANVEYLKFKKVPVFFNVDATKLHLNPNFCGKGFSKIVFNFPHVGGKMKIHLNRDLLRKTFESSSRVIEDGGLMIVSLCQGQGGTPADQPQRRYDDSWQIAEMAAYGDFVLTGVEPFRDEYFQEYQCIGYRSQDVKFNLQGALVHMFRKSKPFVTSMDDEILRKKLSFVPLVDTVLVPGVYSELYRTNSLLDAHSGISFLKTLLLRDLTDITGLGCKVLTDEDVPVYVDNTQGVPCIVHDVDNHYSLRGDSTQVIDSIIGALNVTKLDAQVVVFPGLYFRSNLRNNFADHPIEIEFLVLGKDILSCILKYIDNIVRLFKEEYITRASTPKPSSSILGKTRIQSIIDVVCSSKKTPKAFVPASVYSLEHDGFPFEACILKPMLISEHFFKTIDWREIWAENKVIFDDTGRPVLKQILLYPSEYRFDITLRFDAETGFSEENFYKILWLAGGLIIKQVEFISEYNSDKGWSSKCYRITYKSLDRPVNRSRIIEFHSKIVGRMLELGMGVTVT